MASTLLLRDVLRQRAEPLRRLPRPSRQPPTYRAISSLTTADRNKKAPTTRSPPSPAQVTELGDEGAGVTATENKSQKPLIYGNSRIPLQIVALHTGNILASFPSTHDGSTALRIPRGSLTKSIHKDNPFHFGDPYCKFVRTERRRLRPFHRGPLAGPPAKRHEEKEDEEDEKDVGVAAPEMTRRRRPPQPRLFQPDPVQIVAVHTGKVQTSFSRQKKCGIFCILPKTSVRGRIKYRAPFTFSNENCRLVRGKPPARSLHTSARPVTRPTEGKDVDTALAKNTHQNNNDSNGASTTTTIEPVAKDAEKATLAPVPVPVANTIAPLPIWQRLGPLTRGAEAYARAQRRRPWVTQVATMLVIYLCADISAQQISGKDEHEYERTARSLVIGGVAAIPGHMWFVFLSRNFNYSSKVLSIAVKVAINQAFFTPIFNTYFFGSQALLSGDTLQQSWDRVCATVPISVVNSCKIWPVVTAISFAYLPLEYRALFAGVVAVGWQTYLSFLNRQAEAAEALAMARAGASAALGSQKADGANARVLPSMAAPLKNVAETSNSERTRMAM